nr:hypothetical protein [uncultured Marinifilum sp.]
MFSWYGNFVVLPNEVKQRCKIKLDPKCPRLDCVKSGGYYKGIEPFINKKGMFKFNLMRTDRFDADDKRKADYYLQGDKSMNFSSIYHSDILNAKHVAFGEPNDKPTIKQNKKEVPNPMLPFKNDGYLFIINDDYTKIELLVIEGGRNLIKAYAKKFANGDCDEVIKQLRESATTFYNY